MQDHQLALIKLEGIMKAAIISDIHANHFALEAVISELDKDNIEFILVAGDLIGYYYWPNKVIELLMSDNRVHCIRGNHERMFKEALKDKAALLKYRKKYGSGFDICIELLNDNQLNWLLSLPKTLSLNIGSSDFYISHGGLSSDNEYIYPDTSSQKLISSYSKKKFTIFGNTHYPFIHHHNGRYLINPGSIGQPRDINSMASYVILDLDNDVIQFKRKKFETNKIIEKAKKIDPDVVYLQNVLRRKA